MIAYSNGDVRAFEVLYGRYRGSLYRYFLRQCSSAALAEELFQDVWMKLVRARSRYEVRAKFSTYLFTMAHNHLIDFYRRRSGRIPESYGDDTDPDDVPAFHGDEPERRAEVNRNMDRLLELVAQLPDAQREALVLREEGGLKLEEIAQATGVNIETAKSRLRYAVNKLRKGFMEGNK